MFSSLKILLSSIVDYAGLFPPEKEIALNEEFFIERAMSRNNHREQQKKNLLHQIHCV